LSKLIFTAAALALCSLSAAADLAPTLQWVKSFGGGISNYVAAAATDTQGNLYVTGYTSAIDITTGSLVPFRASADVYVMKQNSNGDVVYITYFGGSAADGPSAIALGPGGSVYVTGATQSNDLPATPGAYLTTRPNNNGNAATFVLKLNASGAVEWATYFPESTVESIAVDSAGSPFIGGRTAGGGTLPTTPGAYNTDFKQTIGSNGFFGVFGPLSAYVAKFSPDGKSLVYSTYVPTDSSKNTVQEARALAVDSAGNAWIGTAGGNTIAPGTPIAPSIVELNPTGTDIVASANAVSIRGDVAAIAFDSQSNVYIAGSYPGIKFPATPGAFQTSPQPMITQISGSGQAQPGGGGDAFVAKWNHDLTTLLAATLLGGEGVDAANSIAVDNAGNVYVGGSTASKAFPIHAPFQTSFSNSSGFAAAFDSNLSTLAFSTYLGDNRQFTAQAVLPDGSGNILVAGTVFTPTGFNGGPTSPGLIVTNKIALLPAPTPRLDSIQHYVSRLAQPLAPGEPIIVTGGGFATGARLVLDGTPLTTVGGTATWLVAVVPDTAGTAGTHTLQISNNGTLSNPVFVPAAAASPGIYTTSGLPSGEAYIVNADGTRNSAANPAIPGSAITIYSAGAGKFTRVGPYAVTDLLAAVFIDGGLYCSGIAAAMEPFDGLPGNVYKLSVTIPSYADIVKANPDLKNYKYPAQASLRMVMGTGGPYGGFGSQNGIYINIKP